MEHLRDSEIEQKLQQKENTEFVLDEWVKTELKRFCNAVGMTDEAYKCIRDCVIEQAMDERII